MSERVTTARVRELRDAATPGPWEHEHIGYGGQEVTMDARHSVFVDGRGNAALLAAAPDLAADLLDEPAHGGQADAGASAGDDGHLAVETSCHGGCPF